MQRSLKRVFAVAALIVLSSSWVVAWSVAVHLAGDDHRLADTGLAMALHGHAHVEGTPAHEHPLVGGAVATLPGRLHVLAGAMIGDAPEVVVAAGAGRRLCPQVGPTHDPPPRGASHSILRI